MRKFMPLIIMISFTALHCGKDPLPLSNFIRPNDPVAEKILTFINMKKKQKEGTKDFDNTLMQLLQKSDSKTIMTSLINSKFLTQDSLDRIRYWISPKVLKNLNSSHLLIIINNAGLETGDTEQSKILESLYMLAAKAPGGEKNSGLYIKAFMEFREGRLFNDILGYADGPTTLDLMGKIGLTDSGGKIIHEKLDLYDIWTVEKFAKNLEKDNPVNEKLVEDLYVSKVNPGWGEKAKQSAILMCRLSNDMTKKHDDRKFRILAKMAQKADDDLAGDFLWCIGFVNQGVGTSYYTKKAIRHLPPYVRKELIRALKSGLITTPFESFAAKSLEKEPYSHQY